MQFYAPTGIINISFKMFNTVPDRNGIAILHVSLQELIVPKSQGNEIIGDSTGDTLLNELIFILLDNNAVSFINKIPGNRIFFNWLADYIRSFDRLRFYYYHHQNLTY